MENVVIIGGGIAGLTAAIYNARANLSPIVLTGPTDGGQLTETTEVENFPGFEHGIMGPELMQVTKAQAVRFGTRVVPNIVVEFKTIDDGFWMKLDNGEVLESHAVIIATGASAKWLGIASETKYRGRGVSACATCDGFFYKGKDVLVVGGGDTAMEEAMFLTKFANKVTLVHRRDSFRASKIMQERALANPKISVIWNSEIAQVLGDEKKMTGVVLRDTVNGSTRTVDAGGLFLAIGHKPNSDVFASLVKRDDVGYIITDDVYGCGVPGLYACGDVQDSRWRQAITAAGSACSCAIEVERYLAHKGHHG